VFCRLTAARPRRARHRPVLRRSPDTRRAELRDATSQVVLYTCEEPSERHNVENQPNVTGPVEEETQNC